MTQYLSIPDLVLIRVDIGVGANHVNTVSGVAIQIPYSRVSVWAL